MEYLEPIYPFFGEGEVERLNTLCRQALEHEASTITVISNDDQFQACGRQVSKIAEVIHEIESQIRPYVVVCRKQWEAALEILNSLEAPLLEREESIKKGLADYEDAKRIAREASFRKAIEEASAIANELADSHSYVIPDIPIAEKPKSNDVSFRTVLKFKIDNDVEVPRNLCSPDEQKIRSYVRALGKDVKIPGVTVWVERKTVRKNKRTWQTGAVSHSLEG